jgi:hypothetical protein
MVERKTWNKFNQWAIIGTLPYGVEAPEPSTKAVDMFVGEAPGRMPNARDSARLRVLA